MIPQERAMVSASHVPSRGPALAELSFWDKHRVSLSPAGSCLSSPHCAGTRWLLNAHGLTSEKPARGAVGTDNLMCLSV